MDLILPLITISIVALLSLYVVQQSEKRKVKTIQKMVSLYENNCKEHCNTNREVTEQFMKVSAEQAGSIVELHKKTLELLSGEKLDDV